MNIETYTETYYNDLYKSTVETIEAPPNSKWAKWVFVINVVRVCGQEFNRTVLYRDQVNEYLESFGL